MFFWSKKVLPKIRINEFQIELDQSFKCWRFKYEDVEFDLEGLEVDFPNLEFLDECVSQGKQLLEEIQHDIKEMVAECEKLNMHMNASSANVSVSIESINNFTVHIYGDDTWGDWGFHASVSNGKIVDEGFMG